MVNTNIVQTPIRHSINPSEPISADETNARIELLEQQMKEMMVHKVNTNTHYFIETSNTERTKLDILKDMGMSASELYIISSGGGLTLEINDEGYPFIGNSGLTIFNETIDKLYVTGSGVSGTARIRVGFWRPLQ